MKKLFLTLPILVVVYGLAFPQTSSRTLPKNVVVQAISPHSDLLACYEGSDSSVALEVLRAKSFREVYYKFYGYNYPWVTFWDENTLLVRMDSTYLPLKLLRIHDSAKNIPLKRIVGTYLKADLRDSLIFFITFRPDGEVRMCRADVRSGVIDTVVVHRGQASFQNYAVINPDSLVLAFEDSFYLVTFANKRVTEIRDSRGQNLKTDGGTLSLTANHNGLLYSEGDHLMLYTFKTRSARSIMNLQGYSSPMLSPDGSFLVLSKNVGYSGQVLTKVIYNPQISPQ